MRSRNFTVLIHVVSNPHACICRIQGSVTASGGRRLEWLRRPGRTLTAGRLHGNWPFWRARSRQRHGVRTPAPVMSSRSRKLQAGSPLAVSFRADRRGARQPVQLDPGARSRGPGSREPGEHASPGQAGLMVAPVAIRPGGSPSFLHGVGIQPPCQAPSLGPGTADEGGDV